MEKVCVCLGIGQFPSFHGTDKITEKKFKEKWHNFPCKATVTSEEFRQCNPETKRKRNLITVLSIVEKDVIVHAYFEL